MEKQLAEEFIAQSIYRMEEKLTHFEKAMAQVSEEDVWKKPNANSNSIGNIIIHLCGNITPDLFKEHKNASHDDVLYAPHKTPEIRLQQARMIRGDQTEILIEHYKPSKYMVDLFEAAVPASV